MTKTRTEIIEETVEYYRTHPRGVNNGGSCVYYSEGRMCAVGRCLKDPAPWADQPGVAASDLFDRDGFDVLADDYRVMDESFWEELQDFHDTSYNWEANDDGGFNLSSDGRRFRDILLERYGD